MNALAVFLLPGVLTVDDDFIIDEEDLKLAFEVWKVSVGTFIGHDLNLSVLAWSILIAAKQNYTIYRCPYSCLRHIG